MRPARSLPRAALPASLGAVLFAFACAAPPPSTAASESPYTLVLLKTGAVRDLDRDQQQQLFAGHFANMERLAKAHDLLLAGPFGEPRRSPELRGLFVLDTADRQRAQQLAGSDPTVQAGVLVPEFHDLRTAAPLRALLQSELERRAAAEREGRKLAPADGIRGYVLLTAERGDAAMTALRGHQRVLLAARLDGDRALFVLDAERPDQVGERLGDALQQVGPHVLDAWFATAWLAHLADRPAGAG